jgi:hypothetical protein
LRQNAIELEFRQYAQESFNSVLFDEKVDKKRVFYMRPSSLPFCGLRRFLNYAENGIATVEEMQVEKLFYTKVGVQAHLVFQQSIGQGGRIIGNWRCRSCRKRRILTTYHRCTCGDVMLHEEIGLTYKSWRGHLDGIYVAKNKGKWIIDYKTCSIKVIEKEHYTPSQTYVEQQTSYVPLLEEKLGEDIEGWMLVFLARENPMKMLRVVSRRLRDTTKAKVRKRLNLYSKLNKRVWKISYAEQVEPLIQYKRCESLKQHDQVYMWNKCPYAGVCFNERALARKVISIVDKSKHLPLIQYMPDKIKESIYGD